MERDEYTEANRKVWDQAEPVHRQETFQSLLQGFRQPGYSTLDATARQALDRIGLAGKSVAQLCCNNGREVLSMLNLGAARTAGFDISQAFIDQGKELAGAAGLRPDLVCADVYAIPPSYQDQFDLVYISVGALGWLPDLPAFFQAAGRLLHADGQLLIYEMHPILNMFEGEDTTDPPPLRNSYFQIEPFADDSGMDYFSMTTYQSPTSYWFPQKMSDVFSACLGAGFQIEDFQEYGHDVSSVFAHFEKLRIKPPLSYTLIARKR